MAATRVAVLAPAALQPGAQHLDGADIITAANGNKLADEAPPGAALLPLEPGQEVTLQVYRNGTSCDVRVKRGSRPRPTGPGARP